jgi:alpha-beta hydrolase superfamily lysophospholipase
VHTLLALVNFNACSLIVSAHFSIQIFTCGKGMGSGLISNYSEKRQKQTVDAKLCQPLLKLDFRWVLSLHLQAQNLD